jgi:hypothetical protein
VLKDGACAEGGIMDATPAAKGTHTRSFLDSWVAAALSVVPKWTPLPERSSAAEDCDMWTFSR